MLLNINKNKEKNQKQAIYDTIILGGGPAGLTAGLYTSRARQSTLIIENMIPGGQAATTVMLENYPGFPDGIGGPQLGALMESQAMKYGAEVVYENIVDVNLDGDVKEITTDNNKYKAKTIILATGAKPRKLNIPGAVKFDGKGISYCATCDGALFADKDVIIVGGGNSAVEEGIFLTRFVKSITFVQDLPQLTAEKILQERLFTHKNISVIYNNKLISVDGEDRISSLTVEKTDTKKTEIVPADGIFVYIGYIPNTEYLKGSIELNKMGYIKADKDLHTSISGVFAAGDIIEKTLRQVATAVGDGALAAFSAIKYLEK